MTYPGGIEVTHAELVERAVRWLRRDRRARVVVTAATVMTHEQPDALGWPAMGFSTLVECKASRSDFLRDQKKWHRNGYGLGHWRFYLTPPDMVKPAELPQRWGLLYAKPRGLKVVVPSGEWADRNWMEEIKHLLAEVGRENRRSIRADDDYCI